MTLDDVSGHDRFRYNLALVLSLHFMVQGRMALSSVQRARRTHDGSHFFVVLE